MPSTMGKNALQAGLYRSYLSDGLELWFPPENPTAISSAQAIAVGPLLLDGAGVRSIVANGKCVLPRPACPVITCSDTTSRFEALMVGRDQWGQKVSWNISKSTAGTVVKTLFSAGARIPPMWQIDSITITAATVAAGTIAFGFSYVSGNTQSVAMPISFPNVAALQGITRLVYVDQLDGFWTAGPFPGFTTTPLTSDADAQRGVLPVTLGTNTAASTAATFTEASLTLTKTNAFVGYVYKPFDTISITGGTDVVPGTYTIAQKVDSSNLILTANITGGGAPNPTDVTFTLSVPNLNWGRMRLILSPEVLGNQ